MKRRSRRSGTGSMAPWSPSRIVLWISFWALRRTTWWATTTMTFSSATGHTVNGSEIRRFHQLRDRYVKSHKKTGFGKHPRWCRICSINSRTWDEKTQCLGGTGVSFQNKEGKKHTHTKNQDIVREFGVSGYVLFQETGIIVLGGGSKNATAWKFRWIFLW